jgi:formylglycine-generating enzyme required for sulfatase activity
VKGSVLKTWGGEFSRQGQALIDAARTYKNRGGKPVNEFHPADYENFPELHELQFFDAQLVNERYEIARGGFPELQEISFYDAQLVGKKIKTLDTERIKVNIPRSDSVSIERLERFEFTIATLARNPDTNGWEIERQKSYGSCFIEKLPAKHSLKMVTIPGGKFMMGAKSTEPGRYNRESPQHDVTVTPFFIGAYPVTQKEWQIVANLPQIELKLNSNPSRFKGANRPVERVSWHEAVEFCARLSAFTGRQYRLPSEAEWEYACRAGTTTPFHFGETITSELANYRARSVYNGGPKGEYRQETTEINHFGIANAFGLSDMHGNVREWCQDHWHDNYEGAPMDGSAWIDGGNADRRVLRGGSWDYNPELCRSAYRYHFEPDAINDSLGFRVCFSLF